MAVAVLAVLAIVVQLSVVPVAQAAGAMVVSAVPNATLDAEWRAFGDTGGGWTGGDSTASVALPDGRIAWFFSDTFVGSVDPDGFRPLNSRMVRNSLVLQDGAARRTVVGGAPGMPESLVPAPVSAPDEFYWVADASVQSGAVQVVYSSYRSTGPGTLDVALTGNALATFDLPDMTLRSVTPLPYGPTTAWGSALLETPTHTYVYGSRSGTAVVARVPSGDLGAPWQFWTGSTWSNREADATGLLGGVGTAFSVDRIGDRYVLVTMDGNAIFDPHVVAHFSPSPTGPFEGRTFLYRAPEVGGTTIAYDARAHPELSSPGKLVITYNVNSLDPAISLRDARLYRPRFLSVDLTGTLPAVAPAAPTALTVVGGDGTAFLSWRSSAPDVAFWVYQKDVTAGHADFSRLPLPIAGNTSMTASNLANGHDYAFKVTAYDPLAESSASNEVRLLARATPPPTPGGLRAAPSGDGQVALSWDPLPGSNIWYWVSQRDLTTGETTYRRGPLPVTTTSQLAAYLTHGHLYSFTVTASNSGGNSPPSAAATATSSYALPTATPTDLRAVAGDGSVALQWSGPDPYTWYSVFQRDVTVGESFRKLELPITKASLSAGYLQNGHTYEWQVRVRGAAGDGPPSATVSARPMPPLPTAPTGATATPGGDGSISLTWSSPADQYTWIHSRDVTAGEGFRRSAVPASGRSYRAEWLVPQHVYEFRLTGDNLSGEGPAGASVQATANSSPPPVPTGLRVVAGNGEVDLVWDPRPHVMTWVYQRNVTAGETSFTRFAYPTSSSTAKAGHLRHGDTYEWQVAAENLGGVGPASAPVRVVAQGGLAAPVTGLVASSRDGAALLSWTASPESGVYYFVSLRNVTRGESWSVLPFPVAAPSLDVLYLVNGDTYEFRVATANGHGHSAQTSPVTVRPMPPVPVAPTDLRAVAGNGAVSLTWGASSTPNVMYEVFQRDVTAGENWRKLPSPVAGTSLLAAYLRNGNLHEFRVRAFNVAGASASTATVSARPVGS